MSLCISQSHRVLSAESDSYTHIHTHTHVQTYTCTHTQKHTSVHCGDLSLRFTVFSPGKPSWECVTLAAVPDKCPLIGMDGGYGAPAMRRSHALTTQCAPKLRLMSQALKTFPNLICLLGLRVTSWPTPLSLCRRTNLHEVSEEQGKIFAHQCEKTRLNPCVGSCIIIANAITSLSEWERASPS